MVDVFISYSRADKAVVARLAERIKAEGYNLWWDEELPPHKSYGDVISAKIAEAKAAIVVWSPDAAASEWVRAEADMARNQKKLIQTALGDIMPPLPFNQIQFADIGDWQGEDDHSGWRKVKASLADLCGTREGGAAPVAVPVTPALVSASVAEPALEPVSHQSSKWPLFAGIAIALIAMAGSAAYLFGSSSSGELMTAGDSLALVAEPETEVSAGDGVLEGQPAPQTGPAQPSEPAPLKQPEPTATAPLSASPGRTVGCYFWNSVYTYDGACRFVPGTDGDFTTFALDGPYFKDVVRIDLDVTSPGTGFIEIYYPGKSTDRVAVRRSANDRACWDGPSLAFCAR